MNNIFLVNKFLVFVLKKVIRTKPSLPKEFSLVGASKTPTRTITAKVDFIVVSFKRSFSFHIKNALLVASIFLLFAFPMTVLAAAADANREVDFSEIAKNRTYPGGSNEGDLKVKDSIAEPTVQVYKNQIDQEVVEEIKKGRASSESE